MSVSVSVSVVSVVSECVCECVWFSGHNMTQLTMIDNLLALSHSLQSSLCTVHLVRYFSDKILKVYQKFRVRVRETPPQRRDAVPECGVRRRDRGEERDRGGRGTEGRRNEGEEEEGRERRKEGEKRNCGPR